MEIENSKNLLFKKQNHQWKTTLIQVWKEVSFTWLQTLMIFLIHTQILLYDIQISHSMKFCTLDTYFESFFTEQTQTQYMKHKRSKLCS
jgi:hypothetical protein